MKKWFCIIIKKDNKYSLNMGVYGENIDDEPINVKYNDLKKYMENKLGFKFLNCKDLIFTKISDFEKMAIIDVTRNREDSRVSIKEMKNGWKPSWEEII